MWDERLSEQGMDPHEVRRIIDNALDEDLGSPRRDVTGLSTIPADQHDTADLVARADGVVAGLAVAAAVFEQAAAGYRLEGAIGHDVTVGQLAGHGVTVEQHVSDGSVVRRGDVLLTVTGPTQVLLAAERTALNLLCRMSGVATHTRLWALELQGTKALVLDTRKTTPGLRVLEKYAVRAGGGTNKRMGLYDVAMIKDNHKLAAGSVTAAYERVKAMFPEVVVQVEVTTLAEAQEAVAAGATFLLLDNMKPDLLREVVAAVGEQAELEATGGLTLEVAAEYAATGVDYLSVGALTHSSPIVDIAMDLRPRT